MSSIKFCNICGYLVEDSTNCHRQCTDMMQGERYIENYKFRNSETGEGTSSPASFVQVNLYLNL